MRRALVLLVALCCVLPVTALAVPTGNGASKVVTPSTNTTGYLMISQSALETSSYQRAGLDVSATLALDTAGMAAQFRQLTLDERFATASSDARRAQLKETAARIEARLEQLRKRQSAAIRAYNNGSLSSREFLVELAQIGAAADRLATATARVVERSDTVPRTSIDGLPVVNWARNVRVALGPLDGPVRERIADALRGMHTVRIGTSIPAGLDRLGPIRNETATPLWLYVETSQNGVVLAMVDDGTYYREAYLPGERNGTGTDLTDITEAFERVKERYPWAWNNSVSTSSSANRRAGIYKFTLFHNHGRLTTFLDRDSGEVFAEHQQKNLRNVPTAPPVTATAGNITLLVNRTHPTGPLEISLSTADGEPVDGRIEVNNRSIGRTRSDGRLWTVAPRGNFTVVAHVDDMTLRVQTKATLGNQTTSRSER